MKTFFLTSIAIFFLLFSCKKEDGYFNNSKFNELNKSSYEIKSSSNGKYLFVHPSLSSIENSEILNSNFSIDNFSFQKKEIYWWFIYSTSSNNIIYKGDKLSIFDTNRNWYDESNILVLGKGPGSCSKLHLYKCIDESVINISFMCSNTEDKNFIFNDDYSYLIYTFPISIDDEYDYPMSCGIKIVNIAENEEKIIYPKSEKGFLNILDLTKDKLEYQEYIFTDEYYSPKSKEIIENSIYTISK